MSEENKNVQETKDDKKEGNVLAGFVLYTDANMDWLRFKKFLKDVKMIDQGSSELNIIIGVNEADFESAMKAIYTIFVDTQL